MAKKELDYTKITQCFITNNALVKKMQIVKWSPESDKPAKLALWASSFQSFRKDDDLRHYKVTQ